MATDNKESMRLALQNDDINELLALMDFEGDKWPELSIVLLEVFEEEGVDAIQACAIANEWYLQLSPPSLANLWRAEMAPRLLQLQGANTFNDQELVAAAAAMTTDVPLGDSQRVLAYEWVSSWVDHSLEYANQQAEPLEELLLPERAVLTAPDDSGRPAIFHPLVLRSLRDLFKGGAYEKTAFDLAKWLTQEVCIMPSDKASVETAFAVTPVIIELAISYNVKISDSKFVGDTQWKKFAETAARFLVDNSTGAGDVALTWRDQQKAAQELFERCVYFQKADLAGVLRSLASDRLKGKIDILDSQLANTESSLRGEWFSPGFESAAKVPLPVRRPAKPFHEDLNFNNAERDEYFGLLSSLQTKAKQVDAGIKIVVGNASQLHEAREGLRIELESPLAKIALVPEVTSGQENGHNPLTTVVLQNHLPAVELESAMFETANDASSLAHSKAWSQVVNQTDEVVSATKAWSALEIWDSRRGSYEWGSDEAETLRSNLPDWLNDHSIDLPEWLSKDDVAPPPGNDFDSVRRSIAIFTLMVVLPVEEDALQTRLKNLLEDGELPGSTKSMLAAARLDLGVTRIIGSVGAGIAFPQINQKDDLPELMGWIALAINSPIAWESRSGMNVLILMARLADTMDDLIIGAIISKNLPEKAKTLISSSVEAILSLDTEEKGSALPLAFVTADLSRYSRSVGRGIVHSGLVATPAWLPVKDSAGNEINNTADLLDALAEHFGEAPRASLRRFAIGGGLPARLLMLSILQIRLNQYAYERRLTVKAPNRDDVEKLSKLRRAMREVMCGDAVLSAHPQKTGGSSWWKEERPPWWQTRYWAGQDVEGTDITAEDPDYTVKKENAASLPPFQLVNWLQSQRSDPLSNALMIAAALEASVPARLPAVKKNEGSAAPLVFYNAGFLRDFDGRLEGELPTQSWKKSRHILTQAKDELKTAEEDYLEALNKQLTEARANDMIKWLKAPIRLSVADFKEQIEAAIAEVRQAEADLEASRHESVAAILEQSASEFIYQAAELECKKKEVLKQISDKEIEISKSKTEISNIEKQIADEDLTIAVGETKITGERIKIASLKLEQAAIARDQILEEIKQIRQVLGGPAGSPIRTDTGLTVDKKDSHQDTLTKIFDLLPSDKLTDEQKEKIQRVDGVIVHGGELKANGRLAAMAVKIEFTMAKQLLDELQEAHNELGAATREERRRKRRAKRNQIITSACKAIGAVVGAYFGGPAGAKLGAEIGAAVAELGIGIAEDKPPEDILMGLVDNAFAIADAAGIDLEKELNDLGEEALGELAEMGDELLSEAESLFESAEKSLGPILESMPKVFDEPLFNEAFQAFGLEEVPGMLDMAEETFKALKNDLGSFGEAVANEGGLGSLLKEAVHFDSPETFRQSLTDRLITNVFKNTADNNEQLEVLGRSLATDVEALKTEKGQAEAAKRLSTLVVNKMGSNVSTFRSEKVGEWLKEMQNRGLSWAEEQVQEEANQLLDNFFPNPETRAEVSRSLRTALLDPETKRGELQALLHGKDMQGALLPNTPDGGWMGELDKKIEDLVKIEQPLSGSRLQVAKVRVDHLTDALVGFNTTLLPFLKAEEGASEAREALLLHLTKLQSELQQQEINVEQVAIELGITQLQLLNNEINEEQKKKLIEKAAEYIKQMELGEEKATLMGRVADLSKLSQEKITEAQKKSSEAAGKRAEAAQVRVQAAQAAVDARKAYLQASLRRGGEASRIRTDLNRASLARSLDVDGAMADDARARHQYYLQRALKAYRELLRFYVSVGADEVVRLQRPNDLSEDAKWSTALLKWLEKTKSTDEPIVTATPSTAINWRLTPQQVKALTSLDGLNIVFKTEEDQDKRSDLFQVDASEMEDFEVGDIGEEHDVPEDWQKIFAENGHKISDNARFKRSDDRVNIRSLESEKPVKVETFDEDDKLVAEWSIERENHYQVKLKDNRLQVLRFIDRYAFYDDRLIEGLTPAEIKSGRILGIFLSIEDPGNLGEFLTESAYDVEAEHIGGVVLSDKEYRLRMGHKHNGKSLNNRLFLIGNEEPTDAVIERAALININDDPKLFRVQGLPLGGTTKLRLVAKGGEEFSKATLHVMYVNYEKAII